jgi:hypothetical protein
MGKIKFFFVTLLSLTFIILCYWIISQGYTWNEMDWNGDGSTSLEEFFESADIQKREFNEGTENCTEYFRLKDGLDVKTVCESN